MTIRTLIRRRLAAVLGCAVLLASPAAVATVVEFQTVLGNFRVNLFDLNTPITVTNFLDYVNNGAYSNSIVHRSDSGFVIQGGGFAYDVGWPVDQIPQNDTIANEPALSNVRGTISMAKLSSGENTATNQWFINLDDNSGNLDAQNEGFAVFGVVMDDGMDVVDAIAAIPTFNFGAPLDTLPLENYTPTDFNNGVDPNANNLIIVNAIVVVNSTADTGANLLPPPNATSSINPPPPTMPTIGSGTGGGSFAPLALLFLYILAIVRRFRIAQRH